MVQNQEVLYATYAMLLRQGLQFEGGFQKKVWGAYLIIQNDCLRTFSELYFPEEIFNSEEMKQLSSQVMILFPQKVRQCSFHNYNFFKLLVGQAGISIENGLPENKTWWLLGGDSLAIAPGEFSIRTADHPMVLAQLGSSKAFTKKAYVLEE